MLNIPKDIERFGHLRLLWELGKTGEAFVSDIKPLIDNLRDGFSQKALDRFLAVRGYHDLIVSILEETKSTVPKSTHKSTASNPDKNMNKMLSPKGNDVDKLSSDMQKLQIHTANMHQLMQRDLLTPTKLCERGIGKTIKEDMLSIPRKLSQEDNHTGDSSSKPNVSKKRDPNLLDETDCANFVDREGNSVGNISTGLAKQFIGYSSTNIGAIPCMVDIKNESIYIIVREKKKQHGRVYSVVLDCDCNDAYGKDRLFGCDYFKLKSFKKKTDLPSNPINSRNVISSLLLSHPKKEKYFYLVRNDWKELSIKLNVKDGDRLEVGYHYPSSEKMFVECIQRYKS